MHQTSILSDSLFAFNANAFARLTGQGQPLAPEAISAVNGGGKFTSEGGVLAFPGNTFICHINTESKAFAALCHIQDELRAGPFAHHFTFLPKASFHMTVFCGVSGSPLGGDGWPQKVAKHTSLEQLNLIFIENLREQTFLSSVLVNGVYLHGGYSMVISPTMPEDETILRDTRNRLRDATSLIRKDHNSYQFHISLGYLTSWMRDTDAKEVMSMSNTLMGKYQKDLLDIELGPIEFCQFDNMHEFRPLYVLPVEAGE